MPVDRVRSLQLLKPKGIAVKGFHVHIHVDDLTQSVAFHSRLFAAKPARIESDCTKRMLDDPRVNFAISACCHKPGLQ